MKIIVQYPPDEFELLDTDLEEKYFVTDQDTYCYFQDKIFMKGIEKFINEVAPGKFKNLEGYGSAEAVERSYDNQYLIVKYYIQYNKVRDRFHLHKGHIYTYDLLGFQNVGNVIQLIRLEMKDILDLLNDSPKSLLQTLMEKIHL